MTSNDIHDRSWVKGFDSQDVKFGDAWIAATGLSVDVIRWFWLTCHYHLAAGEDYALRRDMVCSIATEMALPENQALALKLWTRAWLFECERVLPGKRPFKTRDINSVSQSVGLSVGKSPAYIEKLLAEIDGVSQGVNAVGRSGYFVIVGRVVAGLVAMSPWDAPDLHEPYDLKLLALLQHLGATPLTQ